MQNAVTYAAHLSDGAYRTYAVLVSFDYQDQSSKSYDGVVRLGLDELMKLRGKGRSAIYSHLQELTEAGLIAMTPDGIELYQLGDAAPPRSAEHPVDKPHTNAVAVQKSGRVYMDREEEREHTVLQSSGAEETVIVFKLLKLGFDRALAQAFVARYGPTRVDEQITNLCLALQRGQVIRSYARWLYAAIERVFLFSRDVQVAGSPPRRHVYHELCIDEVSGVITILDHEAAGRAD